jgi:pimeloyl-ACP methyl ester carboxylesterase
MDESQAPTKPQCESSSTGSNRPSTNCAITEQNTCSQPLRLADSLPQWQREAQHGGGDTCRDHCRHYAWGLAPALVFIPGLSLESTSFVMAMSRLRTHFRCVGYELPTGDAANLTRYRHQDLRDDLFALLDHLRLERCYLLGFSFGATVALAALADQPRRFPRAVLVGGFARRPLAWTEVMLAHWARYWPGRVAALPFADHAIRRHNIELYATRPPSELDHFCAAELQPLLRTVAARALLMHRTDLRPLLARIAQPTLLIYGDRDTHVGRLYKDELKQALPNAARAEIESCGHYPQRTHPELFTEITRQFLTPECHEPGFFTTTPAP